MRWRCIQIVNPKTGVIIEFLLKKWTFGAKKWHCIQICQKWRNNQEWRSKSADTVWKIDDKEKYYRKKSIMWAYNVDYRLKRSWPKVAQHYIAFSTLPFHVNPDCILQFYQVETIERCWKSIKALRWMVASRSFASTYHGHKKFQSGKLYVWFLFLEVYYQN